MVVVVVFFGAIRPILSKFDSNGVENGGECSLESVIKTVAIDRRMCNKQVTPLILLSSKRIGKV